MHLALMGEPREEAMDLTWQALACIVMAQRYLAACEETAEVARMREALGTAYIALEPYDLPKEQE